MRPVQQRACDRMEENSYRDVHPALLYGSWAPIDDRSGKIPDGERPRWMNRLESWRIPADYAIAYQRWKRMLADEGAQHEVVRVGSRLLVGHGLPSPTDIGIALHRTWGVPIIPGSALKGILSHYVDAVYGDDGEAGHPMRGGVAEEFAERMRFRGVTWRGSTPLHGPGAFHRAIFGAPEADSDEDFPGSGPAKGRVEFLDALLVPPADAEREASTVFARDVLTPHHSAYYKHGEGSPPNDYENPIPVAFLTVRPGARFLVALAGDPSWARFAFPLLQDALREWGVGGKTAAGYGRFEAPGRGPSAAKE